MKIRTITSGFCLSESIDFKLIERMWDFNKTARQRFEAERFAVQSIRLVTNPWEEWADASRPSEALAKLERLSVFALGLGNEFFGIGLTTKPETIALIPEILATTHVYAAADLGDAERGLLLENIEAAAATILANAGLDPEGYTNMRFCGLAGGRPGIPYFPAAFHQGPPSFGLGMECSDLAIAAFRDARDLEMAERRLTEMLTGSFAPVVQIAERLAAETGMVYAGLDASLAPSVLPEESITLAYETFAVEKFGDAGTLAISAMMTRVLKRLPFKLRGYSGLMLPVLEDPGLAARAEQGAYNLDSLLLYSAVCGCGLDTLPLPGDVSGETVRNILRDVAALAVTLNKPLSARLFPIPGKQAGQRVSFTSPYLIDSPVWKVR